LPKPNLVISASGIRGTVYQGLGPDFVCRLACAFAGIMGKGTYIMGRDTRPSGTILNLAATAGVTSAGCKVVDVGVCPTPTIQLAVEKRGAKGGIAITASHNTAEWNALKLISSEGTFLLKDEVEEVVARARSGEFSYAEPDVAAVVRRDTQAGCEHISEVLSLDYIDPALIRERGFKVALDCTNGAGSIVAPEMLGELGCEVHGLDCEPTGVFRRDPEPTGSNLAGLCNLVRDKGADIGFALDPDADRLVIVDEAGRPVGEDYTLVICADLVLGKAGGPLVTNLSTTMATEEVARRHGADFYRTPIGEISVVTKMKEVGSPIGGEGNGGIILPAVHYGRDSLVGMALVLQSLAEAGGTLSSLMKKFPQYDMFKEKIHLETDLDPDRLRAAMEGEFAGGRFNLDDGVRVEMEGSWLHVRKSGTEPVVRLISEAATMEEAKGLVSRATRLLGK
jgi:phosphomannomutase